MPKRLRSGLPLKPPKKRQKKQTNDRAFDEFKQALAEERLPEDFFPF